ALRKIAAALSILGIVASFVSLAVNGLKFGLDFTGGTQIAVGFERAPDLNKIRQILIDEELESPVAVLFGSDSDVRIRTQGSMQDGALLRLTRQLNALGDDITVGPVEKAAADREGFTQQFVISNITPARL